MTYYLKDITELTTKVFSEAFDLLRDLQNPKVIYDLYRLLAEVIEKLSTVSIHYLVLDFTEDHLQNSSWGEPVDKWRIFLNKDLESLNKSVRKYLLKLGYLGFQDEYTNILYQYYKPKPYLSCIDHEYNVGFVEPCSTTLISHLIDLGVNNESVRISKFMKIDLGSYEQRVELQEILELRIEVLKTQYIKLKGYMLNKYSLEDLL